MKRRNATRSALFTSIISLLLCVSMLVGTTFAWFTDTVTSGINTIAAGNLDVELYHGKTKTPNKAVEPNDLLFTDPEGKQIQYWEPGVVAYTNLKVANVGTLALKYNLSINFGNANYIEYPDGKQYTLADALQVAVVEGGFEGGRAAAQSLTYKDSLESFVLSGVLEADKTSEVFGIVVYWEPGDNETDNLFNINNGKKTSDEMPLHIDLGVGLFATQEMYENDSFGPEYDGGASWVTLADTNWYADPNAAEYIIYSAEELAGLAQLVNTGTSFAGKTVKLGGNIDLAGHAWTPIGYNGNSDWDYVFEGAFDGQGYTISNLYINAPEGEGVGLFGVAQNATIKGINVKNADIVGYSMVATIVGSPYTGCTISDCHVTGKVNLVADWAYVGGVVGYGYTKIDNCSVIAEGTGVIMSKTRNAVGGISAWLLEDASAITNCQVKNLELTGWANIGAITGFMHRLGEIDGCSAENVVMTKTREDGIATIGLAAGGWSYHDTKAITITNNTFKNITLNGNYVANAGAGILYGGEYYGDTRTNFVLDNNIQENITNNLVEVTKAADAAGLNAAIAGAVNGTTIVMGGGEYTLPTLVDKEGVTIVGAADGSTVIGGNTATGFANNFGKDTTIKNVTFSGTTSGVRWSYANGGTSTFENCTFAGDSTYGFHIDQSNGATFIFNNCTFSGFNAFAGDLVKVVFNNCTFLHNGNYGHTNIWSVAEFNDCTFGDKASVGQGSGSGAELYFNGVEESYHHEFVGSAESLFDFAKSVNEGGDAWSGQKVTLVADIDLKNQVWTPIGQTGATQFKGIFDGNGHTISNLTIDSSAQTGANYSSGLFGWLNHATVKNLTIDGATVTGNHNVAVIAGYMETAGCTISNCHVVGATVVAKHANDDACGDKVGVIVGHAGNAGVKVENCSAKDSTVTAGRDAGQIAGAALTANVVGCTATNVTVTASGECTGANINNAIIGRVL